MEKFLSGIRQSRIVGKLPKKSELNQVLSSLSKIEWCIFLVLGLVLTVTTLTMLERINKSFMVGVPLHGGEMSEGIIGTPRFINPVLAFSDVDRDLAALVYSGLMRKSPDGKLIPDLAASYEMSPDGLNYTFTLRDNISFQDGKPVTVEDVLFTINKVKDPIIKSPRKGNWDGVSAQKIDDKTIKFSLKQPYASFLENTTFGILPMHLWSNSPIELAGGNTNPIGSGPYQISKVGKQSSGIIDHYELVPFAKFALGKPYLKKITLRFYNNEEELITALENGEVEQVSSITPQNAEALKEKNYRIVSSVLPRIFGLFFNQNQNQIFTNKVVLNAIDQGIDKEKIIKDVFFGYAEAIDEPIPPNMLAYQKLLSATVPTRAEVVQKVKDSLAKDGWKVGESGFLEKTVTDDKKKKTTKVLEFSISTGNAPELTKTAELIRADLSALGMKVDVKTFEVGNLNQSVIRPRKYDALLFGEIINHEADLFAFWHSSQRKDPGLNVAMYTSAKVDKILEDAFITVDEKKRIEKYAQFESEVNKDRAAVFLYSPNFIYVVSGKLEGIMLENIISPQDRFLNAYSWYALKDNVWKIFSS